jgi:hypothetical protein
MIAKKATGGPWLGKRYPTTTWGRVIEFERLLKPIKEGILGYPGGGFAVFEGGAENA